MSKTLRYLLAIAVLSGLNLFLFLGGKPAAREASGQTYFSGYNLSGLTSISFERDTDSFSMERTGDLWMIGDSKVDEGFFNTLISVLERVESGRKLNWEDDVSGNLTLAFEGGDELKVGFATNPTRTKSYLIEEGNASQISVPGYRDNVVDLFMLHPDQWKDRLVFDGSWRTIQRLTLKNLEKGDMVITFEDKFFLVNGQSPSDSSAVVEYLNQFQYLQANEVISPGRFPELDSLNKIQPVSTIEIDDIKYDQPVSFFIYPKLPAQAYHLVVSNEGQMMVFDERRVQNLLRSVKDFVVN